MSDGEIVRGEGHAPGQGLGEPMPPVKTTERARASDFGRVIAERAARANQPNRAEPVQQAVGKQSAVDPSKQTAGSRMASFQDKLDAQQAAVAEGQETPPQTQEQGETAESPPEVADSEQPEVAEPEAAPDDQSALAKYREWEQSDLFPDEMLGKLHEIPVNGRIEYVDGKELRRGYQRGSDSRRVWAEAQQLQARAQQNEQQTQKFFEAIHDPDQMLEILERNGYSDTLEKVARMVAVRIDGDRRIIQAAADAAIQRLRLPAGSYDHRDVADVITKTEARLKATRETELRERQLAFREQQLKDQQEQQQSQRAQQEWAGVYERQIAQLRPNALRAYGIKDTKANHEDFAYYLRRVIAQQGFQGNITREQCMEAAKDMAEAERDRVAGLGISPLTPQQWAQQQSRPKPLPPTRIGGGAGKPMGGVAAKRGSLSDLEAMVAKGRAGG